MTLNLGQGYLYFCVRISKTKNVATFFRLKKTCFSDY